MFHFTQISDFSSSLAL